MISKTQMINKNITIACTSCGRFKLLKKTILSLEKNLDIFWCRKILTEDSRDEKHIQKMKKAQKDGFLKWWEIIFTWWSNWRNPFESHYQALKTLYDNIDTEFTFHLEDDRLFNKRYPKLLNECIDILNSDKHVWIVCFRDPFRKDIYNFLLSKEEIKWSIFHKDLYRVNWKEYFLWKGTSNKSERFTLNPGLRRTNQMRSIMFNYENYVDETLVGERYKQLWLITLDIPICYHIGGGVSWTRFFKDWVAKSLIRALRNAIKYYFNLLKINKHN